MRNNCKALGTADISGKFKPAMSGTTSLQEQLSLYGAKVDHLTKLVENFTMSAPDQSGIELYGGKSLMRGAAVINNHTDNRITTNLTQININVRSFDNADRISIPVSLVKTAFTQNARLVEYCSMSDKDKSDATKAAPYVLEALVDLIRRAHKDPLYQNVHLNPNRADQAMVYVGEDRAWEVRQIRDVIRTLFDGVSDRLQKIIVTNVDRVQLPIEIQNAASLVPSLYESSPDEYVRDGQKTMAAHFANNGP